MTSCADTANAPDQTPTGATAIGASRTDWTAVRRASDPSASHHADSLEAIARRYWPVVYAFIRQSGRGDDESRDLTQGFLADVLFGRGLLEMASPSRGKFRTLLLHAVSNYLRDDYRRRSASKRHPGGGRLSLSGPLPTLADPSCSPETAFTSAWVAMLMSEAAERCRAECVRDGQEAHWFCFERRVLRPALEGATPVSTDELRTLTGLRTSARVAHAIALVKRRFARLLLDAAGAHSDDPDRVHAEIGELQRMLERGS